MDDLLLWLFDFDDEIDMYYTDTVEQLALFHSEWVP